MGPLAEMIRHVLGEDPSAPLDEYSWRIWAARVQADPLVLDMGNAVSEGFRHPSALVSDDHAACQNWVRQRLDAGTLPPALLVPSAALPGTENLILFGGFVDVAYVRQTWEPSYQIRAGMVTDGGKAPSSLAGLVHRFGSTSTHPLQTRGSFSFREPVTP